jgi:hypothetical protein
MIDAVLVLASGDLTAPGRRQQLLVFGKDFLAADHRILRGDDAELQPAAGILVVIENFDPDIEADANPLAPRSRDN